MTRLRETPSVYAVESREKTLRLPGRASLPSVQPQSGGR